MWQIELRHEGLGKYRLIKGNDRRVVEQKAQAQEFQWNEMWKRRQAIESNKRERAARLYGISSNKQEAKQLTEDAENALKEIDEVLLHTIGVDDAIDWEVIKDSAEFSESKPQQADLARLPLKPNESYFAPNLGFFDKLFKSKKAQKIEKAEKNYVDAIAQWEQKNKQMEEKNQKIEESFSEALKEWQQRKQLFEEDQIVRHKALDEQKERYLAQDPEAITEYCDMVLSRSQYPDYFPQQFDLEYRQESKTLVIEYVLPNLDTLPKLKSVSFIQSREEFKESYIGESQLNKMYDKLLYDISLRTIHEVLEADTVDAIHAVAFNGWVHFISPATGKEVNACILSLHTTKDEFLEISLERVESKACFKSLKGVGSSKLHSLTPIAPILHMDKSDKRFVDSHDVSQTFDDATNIAAIDWQEFEHLVREIFEREFAANGGEVKVTQASRDGGIDAVIFDPDPLRGGKIVVQAKRYNNVVGVSAVRDLYGTVMNEGANKGILITTSDYGPDAYSFAKDKPLTLLNGGNLLHLLEKHGRKARIDLHEAKKRASA